METTPIFVKRGTSASTRKQMKGSFVKETIKYNSINFSRLKNLLTPYYVITRSQKWQCCRINQSLKWIDWPMTSIGRNYGKAFLFVRTPSLKNIFLIIIESKKIDCSKKKGMFQAQGTKNSMRGYFTVISLLLFDYRQKSCQTIRYILWIAREGPLLPFSGIPKTPSFAALFLSGKGPLPLTTLDYIPP